MVITNVSIQRPVLAFVLSAILLVLGALGYGRLPIREFPSVESPVVSVNTSYPGASAEVVDNEITEKIERAANGINGVKSVRSRSTEQNSSVSIEFEITRDLDSAANDVRDAVGRVLRQLPDSIEPPQVQKVITDSQPVMLFRISSARMSSMELTDYARRYIVDRLTAVDGVANLAFYGSQEYAMRIWLDRNAMAAHGVTVSDVQAALLRENTELPAGRIESGMREFTVRTATRLNTVDGFTGIVIRQDGNTLVRIGDVAKVEIAPRDTRGGFMMNGELSSQVSLGVVRQSAANTLDVAAGVYKVLDDVRASLPPGASMEFLFDDSVFIRASIKEVFLAIGLAAVLVMAVIWCFLGTFRATIIPMAAVPVSLISAIGVLAAFGYSINVLTLLAFVLGVGLVVDDAIVVVENVSRRIEDGEPPLLAAYRGSREIAFAVMATTLVLIAVILPLTVLEGSHGRLFREFGVALSAAIVFSCVVALTLSPMLCSKILASKRRHGRLLDASNRAFAVLAHGYGRLLDRALSAPTAALVVLAICIAGSVGIYLGRPQELTPLEDRGMLRVSIIAPEGATLDYTMSVIRQAQGMLKPYYENGVIAAVYSGVLNPAGASVVNRGLMNIRLNPWNERPMTIHQLLSKIRGPLMAIPGARFAPSLISGIGSFSNSANQIQFVIGGNTFDELVQWRDILMQHIGQPGSALVQPQANYDETKPQLQVTVDRTRAAELGVPIATIGATLESTMGGRQVTRYLDRGEEYDVVVQALPTDRTNPRDLSNVYVRGTRTTQLVPLLNLIQVSDMAGSTELNRFDRRRAITFTAVLAEGASMGQGIDEIRQVVREVLPSEAHLSFDGIAREHLEASQSIIFAFGLAVLVAFLVLAAQFENFILPGIILLSAPLAIFGGMVSILVFGLSVNVYTEIALIMLIGLVAKNAILIVEFANQRRADGRTLDEAIGEAARIRLRPILMTSIATAFGALPLALASGAGAEARTAVGCVIVGGVTIGTTLSLFITPVLYRLLARNVQPIGAVRRRLRRLEEEFGMTPEVAE